MIRHLSAGLALGLLFWLSGHAQSAMYTKVVTTGGNESVTSNSIIADPSGQLYITGTFESTCHFGNDSVTLSGSENMFLAKYNPSSGFLWSVAPDASWRAQGQAVAFDDQGSLYVTGYFFGNIDFGNGFSFSSSYFNTYIAKYDSSGNLIWAKPVGGDDNNPRSITGDDEGNIYIAGQFDGNLVCDTISIYSFNTACYLLKIGRDGEVRWISHSGGSGMTYPKSVSVDPSGDIVVSGMFINPISFGAINLEGFGSYDVFICRVDASGHFIWAVQAGGTGDDEGLSVVCGNDGSIFIDGFYEDVAHFGSFVLNTGEGYGSYATCVVKTDASGNFVWAKSLDVACRSNNLMCIDTKNNIYLTSSFWGSVEIGPSVIRSNGYGDIYVIKMDKDGQILWAKGAGSTYVDDGLGIGLQPSGDIAVTGIVSNEAIFDSIIVTPLQSSIFIAILHQHGFIAVDEINYHSSDSLDTGDWAEIHNTGSKTIDLTGWILKDGNDNNEYVINTSTMIEPGQFLVFYQDKQKFMHFHPDIQNITGPFNFELASNGEKVRLYDETGLLIAQVRYYSTSPWPGMANGTGRTIELLDSQGELSDGNNWFTGCQGGSPGRRYQDCDSLGINPIHPPIQSMMIFPDPVTDLLTIEYYSPEGTGTEFLVLGATGRSVKKVFLKDLKQGKNIIVLSVKELPPGIYLALMTYNSYRVSGKFIKSNRGN